jgi:hypothetical protein
MKHPGHTYGGFVPSISERGMTEWQKGGFSSRLASDEITTCGYKVLTFGKCITMMIAVLAVTSCLGSSFD